jgi:hypothetical protein
MSSGGMAPAPLPSAEVSLKATGRDPHLAIQANHEGQPIDAAVEPRRGDAKAAGGLSNVKQPVLSRISTWVPEAVSEWVHLQPGREGRRDRRELGEHRWNRGQLHVRYALGVRHEIHYGQRDARLPRLSDGAVVAVASEAALPLRSLAHAAPALQDTRHTLTRGGWVRGDDGGGLTDGALARLRGEADSWVRRAILIGSFPAFTATLWRDPPCQAGDELTSYWDDFLVASPVASLVSNLAGEAPARTARPRILQLPPSREIRRSLGVGYLKRVRRARSGDS